MKKRLLGIALLILFVGMILGGCGCFQQAMKGETPPPPAPAPVVQPAPAPPPAPTPPPPPPPPAKPDRH